MSDYYVNKRPDQKGNNEVHTIYCDYYPLIIDKEYLGDHPNCQSAVAAARLKGYPRADGCFHCSRPCHTG